MKVSDQRQMAPGSVMHLAAVLRRELGYAAHRTWMRRHDK